MAPRVKTKPKSVTSTDLARNTGSVLEDVLRRKVVMVKRRGRPLAYLIEASAYEEMSGAPGA